MRGGRRVIIEPHRHEGVFIARGKEDALVTKNLVPGEAVYGEKKISVEVRVSLLVKQNYSLLVDSDDNHGNLSEQLCCICKVLF